MDNKDKPNKTVVPLKYLKDLEQYYPATRKLYVEMDEDVLELEVRILSHAEWMAIEHSEPHVERRDGGVTAQGKVYDYNHPDYQRDLRKRNDRIAFKRLASCITAEIPGKDVEEKASTLAEYPAMGVMMAIYAKLVELHQSGEVAIVEDRHFRANGNHHPSHLAGASLDV